MQDAAPGGVRRGGGRRDGAPKRTADADGLVLHAPGRLTPATVRQAAAEVGKITDFDAQYARAIQEVKTDTALGSSLGVDSTPTFFVNGRRVPGGGSGAAAVTSRRLLELELRRDAKVEARASTFAHRTW